MKITKKLAAKLHEGAQRKKNLCNLCNLWFLIFILIIILSVPPQVYTKDRKQEHKGKSNSFSANSSTQSKKTPQYRSRPAPSQRPSRSGPPPGVENKTRSGGLGKGGPNQGKPGKLGVKTGKLIRYPRKPPPEPTEPTPKPPPEPRPPRPPCPGYLPVIIDPTPGDEIEEDLAPPDPGNTLNNGQSGGLTGKEYYISDSFVPDRILVKKIEEYNAKHPRSPGLEYPVTARSESLTYQLLDSLELIERMEKKIQYYKQQLDAVRNSDLSPADRSSKELFWLERLDRLQESKQKEEERVFELRSQIEEENRKL
jgi:hypothetical protein